MKTELRKTGERMIEDAYHENLSEYVIYLFHAASYQFAEQFCSGKRVLDLGCGSGYGASRISEIAANVQAVDVSAEAIAYASRKYPKQNLHFSTIKPGCSLPFPDLNFDVVLSFQVIEHVSDHESYLREASRVLDKAGVLILITPDRKNRLLPMQKPWNRWHLREYDMQGLCDLTAKYFDITEKLEMSAKPHIAEIELKRYRLLKWLTLPMTLPLLPESVRQFGLNLLHRLKQVPQVTTTITNKYSFGIEAVSFSQSDKNSLNLIVVANSRH